jgi:hypothetical protein
MMSIFLGFIALSVLSYFVGQLYILKKLNNQYNDPRIMKHQRQAKQWSTFSHVFSNFKKSLADFVVSLINVLGEVINVCSRLKDVFFITFLWFLVPVLYKKAVVKYQQSKEESK